MSNTWQQFGPSHYLQVNYPAGRRESYHYDGHNRVNLAPFFRAAITVFENGEHHWTANDCGTMVDQEFGVELSLEAAKQRCEEYITRNGGTI